MCIYTYVVLVHTRVPWAGWGLGIGVPCSLLPRLFLYGRGEKGEERKDMLEGSGNQTMCRGPYPNILAVI